MSTVITTTHLAEFARYLGVALDEMETALRRRDVAAAVAVADRVATDTSPQVADKITRHLVAKGLHELADRIRTGGQ